MFEVCLIGFLHAENLMGQQGRMMMMMMMMVIMIVFP